MNRPILTILKKELARFFGDKRMVVTIFLPGILIYVLYSVMGSALTSQYSVEDGYQYTAAAVNLPQELEAVSEPAGVEFVPVSEDEVPGIKEQITNQEGTLDVLAVFPEDFSEAVASYDSTSGTEVPNVEVYYNSVSTNSAAAFQAMTALLDGYESTLINKFDVNRGGAGFDLASERDLTGSVFSSLLPMLLMIFLFSGCMAVAPESIAGEKERGTMATLLVTPVPRSSIAIGKIMALSLIALLAGASSALGTILSLPKLMGAAGSFSGDVYRIQDYLALAMIILSTVLVLIALISIVSTFAKSTKEAQSMVTPLMILVMVVGITAMFGNVKSGVAYYFIPLYNSVQCMSAIFSFEASAVNLWVTVAVNLAVSGIGVFLLTKMFRSERVIFSH